MGNVNHHLQDFENGRMLWLSDLDEIFVLYDNGDWKKYDNRFMLVHEKTPLPEAGSGVF